MNHLGVIIAFITTLSWSIGIFPFTEATRRLGTNAVNHLRLLLAVIAISCISLMIDSSAFISLLTSPDGEQWMWFGLSGVVGLSLGDYFGFTSFAILGTRIGSVFITLSPGAALLFGYLVLNERINLVGIIGIAVTVGGIIWLSLSKDEKEAIPDHGHGTVKKGILFAILSALCQGIGLVFAKKGMTVNTFAELSGVNAAWLRIMLGCVSLYMVTIVRGKFSQTIRPIVKNEKKGVKFVFIGALFGAVIGIVCAMYAVTMINVSVAQTIFSLVPVLALPLGYLFYRERISLKSIIGAIVAISGVVILIWREEIMELL